MIYPDFEELLRLGYRASRLSLTAKRKVRSVVSGDYRSPFRGKGLEFEEVREYVAGDDVRNIDWRVTARTGVPHLKLFSEERERSILICNDVNLAMRYGTRGTFKSVQAARAAALLGWAACRENNRIGASFYGNVPGGMIFIDPARSRKALWRMLKQLCAQDICYEAPVLLEDHLKYLVKAVPLGALVFIVSDFLTLSEGLKKRLADLHRRADVVLVAVNDPADERLPPVGPVMFEDESGRKIAIDTSERRGAHAYQLLWQENRKELERMVNALGLGLIALTTPDDVNRDLVGGLKRLGRKGSKHGRSAVAA